MRNSAGHYVAKCLPVSTAVIKAILFLILVHNPPQASKSKRPK